MNDQQTTPTKMRKLVSAAANAVTELSGAMLAEVQAKDDTLATKVVSALRSGQVLHCGLTLGPRPAITLSAKDSDGTLLPICTAPLTRVAG